MRHGSRTISLAPSPGTLVRFSLQKWHGRPAHPPKKPLWQSNFEFKEGSSRLTGETPVPRKNPPGRNRTRNSPSLNRMPLLLGHWRGTELK